MHGLITHRKTVYFFAAFMSVLLSLWAVLKESVINPDAICYLQSAQSMPLGLSFAAHICDQAKWPFYSMLIYGVSSVTHLSWLHAAYLLDGFFSLISVLTFIAIIRFLKGSTRVLWFAAFAILLAHEFNAVREYIIRDHGFWAFYLLSMLFLLRYFQKPRWCYALLWSSCLLLATLFRVEGLFFLVGLPFVAWLLKGARWQSFLKLNTLAFIGLVMMAGWFFLHPHASLQQAGRLGDVQFQLVNGFTHTVQHFQVSTAALKQHVLNRYAAQDASMLLFLMLLSSYLVHIVSNLTFVYAALVVYAWCRRMPSLDTSARIIIWSYAAINIAVTAVFFAENMFLSKRYLLALSLTLMLWVPFALDNLAAQWSKRKWPIVLALFLVIVSGLGGIFEFGHSKKYLRDAGDWLAQNLPRDAKLYSNDYQVMYYSAHFGNDIFTKAREFTAQIPNDSWQQYDYVALRLDKSSNLAPLAAFGAPAQQFKNKRGDQVLIYKVH